nr:pro-sigmaK processing inhibitor BofA family protein [Thermococcus sp. M36]
MEGIIFLILLAVALYVVVKLTIAVLKWMAANAIVGLILVGILNFLGVTHIALTPLNFLIIAIGGVVGVFLLVLLSLF